MLKKLLLALVFLACYYSYSNSYDQQYQVGDTGPNGGEVTNVILTETLTDSTSEVIGDFIEYTDTYLYQETITESVGVETSTTTYVSQEIETSNLITTELQDTGTMSNVFDCSNTNNCYGMGSQVEITTGNQQQGGGSAIVDFDLSTYTDMQELDYGGKVYSHPSNANVPNCANYGVRDCKDEFKVTLTLKNGNSVVDTFVHNYTDMNWTGVQDYAFNQDVSNKDFDSASLEFYGVDRGYNTGYYGPGFSDAFLIVTYNALVAQINTIIDYTVMTTIKQTEESITESVYSPQFEMDTFEFEPLEVDVIEISFDTSMDETMSFEIEVVEVDNVVEVNITSDFGGEMEVETIEVIDIVEVMDMPETSMDMDMPDIDMQMAELEIEMPEIEMSMPEPEMSMEPEVEAIEPEVEVDTATEPESMEPEPMEPENMEPESMEPESMEPEPMEPESTEPEPESTEPEESNEPESEPEESNEPESRSEPESEPEEQESDQKESKEKKQEKSNAKKEKIKAAVAKAKQKVAQKILAKIISANDTIALDNTKLALMIALSDQQGFSAYQELTLQDMEFYLDNGLLDAYIPTNNMGQYFLFGGSDVQMNDLVNMQYE